MADVERSLWWGQWCQASIRTPWGAIGSSNALPVPAAVSHCLPLSPIFGSSLPSRPSTTLFTPPPFCVPNRSEYRAHSPVKKTPKHRNNGYAGDAQWPPGSPSQGRFSAAQPDALRHESPVGQDPEGRLAHCHLHAFLDLWRGSGRCCPQDNEDARPGARCIQGYSDSNSGNAVVRWF